MDENKKTREEKNEEKDLDESTAHWYVVHTYSGYENKVKDKIQMLIENEQSDMVYDVKVPMEKYTEIKNNERVVKERKMLPGYVLVKMNITATSWFLIRNTHGVTGFVGPGSEPIPLTKKEIAQFGVREQAPQQSVSVKPGDQVEVVFGPFTGFTAEVQSVDADKRTLKGLVSMFGRDTSVELSFDDIECV